MKTHKFNTVLPEITRVIGRLTINYTRIVQEVATYHRLPEQECLVVTTFTDYQLRYN